MLGVRSFHNTLYNQLNSYDSDGDYYDPDRGICACEEIAEVFKQHIGKVKAAGFYASERNLLLISNDDKINNFQDECEAEIEITKGEKINNSNASFYNILTQSISQLAIYAKNENTVQTLKSDDYMTKFPIYASMIDSQFRRGVDKKELLEQGNNPVNKLIAVYQQTGSRFQQIPTSDSGPTMSALKHSSAVRA